MRPSRALPSCLAAAGIAVLLLAGCTPDAKPTPSSTTRAPSASGSPSASASPTPSASASTTSGASPVSIPCTSVVSNQTVYDFNPIYSPKAPAAPPAGSAAAQVKADRGTVCEWVNTSSGATIDVAIGKYSAAALERIRTSTFTGGASASGWGGDAGYFAVAGDIGTASALVSSYWVTARGQEFVSPQDADPFMQSAVAAAKNAG